MRKPARCARVRLRPSALFACAILALLLLSSGQVPFADATTSPFPSTVGVSYSRLFAANPLPATQAMQQIKQNFDWVRFYDFDEELMNAALAAGLEIVLSIPNGKLTQLDSADSANNYVSTSVSTWKSNIKAIIVGNEIFLNGYQSGIVTKMQTLVTALQNAGITNIPVTTNINLAVLASSYPVDQSTFQSQYQSDLTTILGYTEATPGFVFVNIYPWYAIQANPPPTISLGYATFQAGSAVPCKSDGSKCQSLFQAQYLAWHYAVQALLPGNTTEAYIGETGWASAGGSDPSLSSDATEGQYINGYINWVTSQSPQIPSLLFEMYDESNKPGADQEGHWGLYDEDGTAKFQLSSTGLRMAAGNLDGTSESTVSTYTASSPSANNDVVGVTSDGQVYYALDNGSWQHLAGKLAQVTSGDLGGDGRDEIVGLTDTGEIFYTDNLADWHWVPGKLNQIAVCDLNGDGKEDLLGVTVEGEIYYSLDLAMWQTLPGILSQVTCGDLNGDGKNDLAGVTRTGEIYYSLDRTTWQPIPGMLSQLALGFIDADTKADLVGISSTGQIFYTLNLLDWNLVPGTLRQVTIGDFNSDAQGDLIGFAADGSIYVTEDLATWRWKEGAF